MKITKSVIKKKVEEKNKGPFRIGRGMPLPLGTCVTHEGVNFAIFSSHATRLELLLFKDNEDNPIDQIVFDPKLNRTGEIWHLLVYDLDPSITYAYRAYGPYDTSKGHRFNPKYLLIDPYTRGLKSKRYSRIICDEFDWENDSFLAIPLKDSIIYETHVKGYTCHPNSGTNAPGTFKGLTEKIPYFKELGITAIELMPVSEFDEEDNIYFNPHTGEKLKNFWGYDSIAFFAPKATYAGDDPVYEIKEMVKSFHQAGIEVILDVVFNHTAEGNESGPTLSFRGLDNSVYYILGPSGEYLNFSGCGNTLNCNHPLIRNLIMDCLHYWVTEIHIDGFRFDLASILGRGRRGEVLSNPPLLENIAADPVLADTKIIAEAWDAAGLYQVGTFPAWGRWAEWNGKYRDDIRRVVRGEPGMIPYLATRIAGSADLYQSSNRRPYHSINFITSHDGFTLSDLVSYNYKHNEANGEENRDGTDANWSWNCGIEGDTDNESVMGLRGRQMKNFFTILMLSQGVPMILGGDEFCRTQQGNNNPYCQDNKISWVDWSLLEKNSDFFRFCKEMIAFRKRHPILRRSFFLRGNRKNSEDLPDISWHGVKVGRPDWSYHSRSLAFLMAGTESDNGPDNDIYVAMNFFHLPLRFEIPEIKDKRWYRVIDTFLPPPHDILSLGEETMIEKEAYYAVFPYSVVVLISKYE